MHHLRFLCMFEKKVQMLCDSFVLMKEELGQTRTSSRLLGQPESLSVDPSISLPPKVKPDRGETRSALQTVNSRLAAKYFGNGDTCLK